MPAFTAHAPGKAILFGEHAVVYGRPAIAVPVHQVQARATVTADPLAPEGRVLIDAPDVDLQSDLADLPADHPSRLLNQTLLKTLDLERLPALRLKIKSDIPVAAGLGSGAAVSVAVLRALAAFLGRPLNDEQVCAMAYEVEKAYHGNPSGIDNTVITYACPIYFQRGKPFELIHPAQPIKLVIGDSGIASPTSIAVSGVRQRWEEDRAHYEAIFDEIASLTDAGRTAIEAGQVEELGPIMNANQRALEKMGVSIVELDRLIQRALEAGAWGAKLSGAGLGGNMIALAPPEQAEKIARALSGAGATRVIITTIPANPE
jgi:mevalonate kinase